MRIRRMAAIWAGKAAAFACKKMGRQGATWAGKIAIKIYPAILEELAGEIKEKIYVVCGTNGKTTTNNMLCSALETEGKKVVCNHTGSNMFNGVVSAFVLSAKLNGKLDADYACIEADEASTRYILPAIKPDYVILTNLFRDQLDRYGEIDTTINLIKEMIQKTAKTTVIVNGDDALTTYLAQETGNKVITYGVGKPAGKNELNEVRDGRFCKKCGGRLHYNFYHYSQLGDYECPQCGFKRPQLDFDAEDVQFGDQISFTVQGRRLFVNYKGFYNVYNVLAAYTGLRCAGFSGENFNEMLKKYNPENGRMETFRIQGTGILLNLAKNPAGFNQNISAIMQENTPKDIIIAINDNVQDGIDISWLWDVDFDKLKDESVKSITVSGIRALDMELRMKYVDIPANVEMDMEKAIRDKISNGTGNLYVLVNFTALPGTRAVLKKLEGEN